MQFLYTNSKREVKYYVSLVDFDAELTGKRNDIFVNLAHINDDGRVLKAASIGNTILKG